jgi:hypothetical protein
MPDRCSLPKRSLESQEASKRGLVWLWAAWSRLEGLSLAGRLPEWERDWLQTVPARLRLLWEIALSQSGFVGWQLSPLGWMMGSPPRWEKGWRLAQLR